MLKQTKAIKSSKSRAPSENRSCLYSLSLFSLLLR